MGGGAMVKDLFLQCGGEELKSQGVEIPHIYNLGYFDYLVDLIR
jgi:hypothetical protein